MRSDTFFADSGVRELIKRIRNTFHRNGEQEQAINDLGNLLDIHLKALLKRQRE